MIAMNTPLNNATLYDLKTDRDLYSLHLEKTFQTVYLGSIPYAAALELQSIAVQSVIDGIIPGIILFLQHPPVITIGRFRGDDEIKVPQELLRKQGIEIYNTNRGGSVTCHEPGQLVGYPIISLREHGLGVRDYVWKLEEVIIRALNAFHIEGKHIKAYPGVWVGEKKICSVGIHIHRNVTMHGFALNVSNDLKHFEYINPCGMEGITMTSMSRVVGYDIGIEPVIRQIRTEFFFLFGL